nr:unnamed protein product [Callosobruchus analis]
MIRHISSCCDKSMPKRKSMMHRKPAYGGQMKSMLCVKKPSKSDVQNKKVKKKNGCQCSSGTIQDSQEKTWINVCELVDDDL